MRAHGVTVQVLDDGPTLFDGGADEMRDCRLARTRQAREPKSETAVTPSLRLRMLVRVDVIGRGSGLSAKRTRGGGLGERGGSPSDGVATHSTPSSVACSYVCCIRSS